MLQVRELAVEVGGRYTLTEASFSLHAGDKVGLVGRNGAGKTSLLKVLAGATPAAHGVVLRPETVGFLPQDPPARGVGLDGTALSHVLSGRGLDAALRRLEELRTRVDADPSLSYEMAIAAADGEAVWRVGTMNAFAASITPPPLTAGARALVPDEDLVARIWGAGSASWGRGRASRSRPATSSGRGTSRSAGACSSAPT